VLKIKNIQRGVGSATSGSNTVFPITAVDMNKTKLVLLSSLASNVNGTGLLIWLGSSTDFTVYNQLGFNINFSYEVVEYY